MNIQNKIESFISKLKDASADIYNEFSLQHELGIFLRKSINDKKIQFERNISYFGFDKKSFIKKNRYFRF